MKDSKRNIVNLVFSSFLVIGYIVCTYFFSTLANQVGGNESKWIQIAILLVFGLLLFYATRVGEGRQVKRFSPVVLVLLDLPCIYIIAAAMVKSLPFHSQIAPGDGAFPMVLSLAVVALGYGIPYTFLSGYEMQTAEDEADVEDETVVEGGIAEELAEAEAEEDTEPEIKETKAQPDEAETDTNETEE